MIFNILHSGFDYFGFFTGLSLLFLGACFIFLAHKKFNIPVYQLAIIYLNTVLFIFAGAKLFTISSNEWMLLFTEGRIPQTSKLTVMGALLFGPLGMLAGKKMFGVKVPILDLIAIPVLLSMGIQRLGCLFAGCCFGLPTQGNWGISYSPFTSAHAHAYDSGFISNFNLPTVPLHPVQVYLIALCILSIPILLFLKNKIQAKGNFFLLALICFFAGRFFIEFFRDPITNEEAGQSFFGLKLVQLFLILLVLLFTCVVFIREKRTCPGFNQYVHTSVSLLKSSLVLVLLSVLIYIIKDWFTPLEKCTLFIVTCSAIILFCIEVFSSWFSVPRGWNVVAFSVLIVFFILPCSAQIVFDNDKNEVYSYKEMSFTGTYHTFSHFHNPATLNTYTTSGCNGTEYHNYYTYSKNQTHEIITGSLNFAQYFNYGQHHRLFYKASFALGQDTDDDPDKKDSPPVEEFPNITSGSASAGVDFKYAGIEFGICVGEFRMADEKTGEMDRSLSAGKPEWGLLPCGRLRIGATKILYFEANAGNPQTGLNGARYPITIGMATGMGRDNGTVFRTGIGKSGPDYCGLLGTKFMLPNNNAVEANAWFGISPYYSVSISHFFGIKPLKKKLNFELNDE